MSRFRNSSKSFKLIVSFILLLLIGSIGISTFQSFYSLSVNSFTYPTPKVSSQVRLCVLADLHDRSFEEKNSRLVSKVESVNPDLIILDGDMLNHDSPDADIVCTLISKLKDICPVYFGLGNHEIENRDRIDHQLVSKIEDAGAVVLDEDYEDIEVNGNTIRLGGLYAYAFGSGPVENEAALVEPEVKAFLEEYQNTDNLKIMMSHRPDSFIFGDASKVWDIDLVISGHLHGGQVVLPFLGGVFGGDQGYFPKYIHGMYEKDNMNIFITSGLGSGHKPLPRFNNIPEIAVIDIVNSR